jgi:hypothetical protein
MKGPGQRTTSGQSQRATREPGQRTTRGLGDGATRGPDQGLRLRRFIKRGNNTWGKCGFCKGCKERVAWSGRREEPGSAG